MDGLIREDPVDRYLLATLRRRNGGELPADDDVMGWRRLALELGISTEGHKKPATLTGRLVIDEDGKATVYFNRSHSPRSQVRYLLHECVEFMQRQEEMSRFQVELRPKPHVLRRSFTERCHICAERVTDRVAPIPKLPPAKRPLPFDAKRYGQPRAEIVRVSAEKFDDPDYEWPTIGRGARKTGKQSI